MFWGIKTISWPKSGLTSRRIALMFRGIKTISWPKSGLTSRRIALMFRGIKTISWPKSGLTSRRIALMLRGVKTISWPKSGLTSSKSLAWLSSSGTKWSIGGGRTLRKEFHSRTALSGHSDRSGRPITLGTGREGGCKPGRELVLCKECSSIGSHSSLLVEIGRWQIVFVWQMTLQNGQHCPYITDRCPPFV